jgi:hypothetical protein
MAFIMKSQNIQSKIAILRPDLIRIDGKFSHLNPTFPPHGAAKRAPDLNRASGQGGHGLPQPRGFIT